MLFTITLYGEKIHLSILNGNGTKQNERVNVVNDGGTRVRTIKEAVKYFKEKDPNTALRETALRRIIKRGDIPVVWVGRKQLVSIESIEKFLSGSSIENRPVDCEQSRGVIRRVEE